MIFDKLKEMLAETANCDADKITMDTTFAELGIDSLDIVDLVMKIEDELGVELEMDQKLETVGDTVNFIEAHQK